MPDGNANPNVAARREVRVFLSSTFRDMREEREELTQHIFPLLRRICESRGATWGDVDLRSGFDDEISAEGRLLPLSLNEIERCRPFFIGILGERYGLVPESIPDALLEAESWLQQHTGDSVTALEMFHGALRDPQSAEHAFFYFRDPNCAQEHPGYTEPEAARRERLANLKDQIRNSGLPLSEPFTTPGELGEWVLRDLTAAIDRLYPAESVPDALDRAAADHEAYAASRRRVYIGRSDYSETLNAHAAGEGPPVVVTGEVGCGKSALLANWIRDWSQEYPRTPVLAHFIGASPESADWVGMLRRLLGEFRRNFSVEIEIPEQPEALPMCFANALHMVAARGRMVLVLDGLDQIDYGNSAPGLVWLPPTIPANVRLIVSTHEGQQWDDLQRRMWQVLKVDSLLVEEREALVAETMERDGKKMSQEDARRIVHARQTGNALYLTALMNEVRSLSADESLEKRGGLTKILVWYLATPDSLALYRRVLLRWEHDYGADGSATEGLVGESLARMWAARRGLSGTEFLEAMGSAGFQPPRAAWSALSLGIGDALIDRAGLLMFTHGALRQAVQDAYLPTVEDRQSVHQSLAMYFYGLLKGSRQLEELPWQWEQAAEWKSLAYLLGQPAFLGSLWEKGELEVKAFWSQIEEHSTLRLEKIYAAAIQQPADDCEHAWRVSVLLAEAGRPEVALDIRTALVEHFRTQGDGPQLRNALGGEAKLLEARGDLDEAMALYAEQERLCRAAGITEATNKADLQTSLGNQAGILFARGDLDGALALYREQENLCRELGSKRGHGAALGKQAEILHAQGDLKGAIELLKSQERLHKQLGDRDGLAVSLGNQASALKADGNADGAMESMQAQERIFRELGNDAGLATVLGNQALLLNECGELNGAMARYKEQERLCRDLGHSSGQAASLANQAALLIGVPERRGEARLLANLSLAIATRTGYQELVPGIQQVLNSL